MWRVRVKIGHVTVVNWRLVGTFLTAVVLHALRGTFASVRSATIVEFLGLVFF